MSSSTFPSGIEVSLNDQKTWEAFYPKTEMIVTKKKGRVIFPHLNYNIKGMDAGTLYSIYIHLERVNNIKYKFDAAEWKEVGKGDVILPIQYKEHPDGVRPGSHWMKKIVSFSHIKMTNDPENSGNRLILAQSMHRYRPVITVTKVGDYQGEEFRLNLTEFMVVTAYQNEEIIKLKVSHNKFASGFRSNGKRRNSSDSENMSPDGLKHRCISSNSSFSPPIPTVSTFDQSLNPLNPVLFNQDSIPVVPNQYYDFTAGNAASQFYWTSYYQAQSFNWNQMQMNQWNTGSTTSMHSENLQNGFNNF